MIKLIQNGVIYSPDNIGTKSILVVGDTIAKIGDVNTEALQAVGLEVQVINAEGSMVIPGFIDPHIHLIGGGGEGGFATRTPEIQLSELVKHGITTVVGVLGTDGTTRHMTSLLAKARGLEEEGMTTYIYSGNYHVPPPTITSCVKDDIILIDKVIGVGEIAISDSRSAQPSLQEIAKLAAEARIGGLLAKKAGVIHFHVGPGKERLALLHQLLATYEIPPTNIYATHVSRSRELVDDAISLSQKGAYVDITADSETGEWIRYFRKNGGDLSRLTISSDGNGSLPKFDKFGHLIGFKVASPKTLYEQVMTSVKDQGLALETVLPLVTRNTANVLHLESKGVIREGADADMLILDADNMDIQDVFAKGRHMVKNGEVIVKGTFENDV